MPDHYVLYTSPVLRVLWNRIERLSSIASFEFNERLFKCFIFRKILFHFWCSCTGAEFRKSFSLVTIISNSSARRFVFRCICEHFEFMQHGRFAFNVIRTRTCCALMNVNGIQSCSSHFSVWRDVTWSRLAFGVVLLIIRKSGADRTNVQQIPEFSFAFTWKLNFPGVVRKSFKPVMTS